MKKLFTTAALVALGTLSTLTVNAEKKVITASQTKKANYKSLYILISESGEKVKAFAWGQKRKDTINEIMENNQTAEYTLGKTKNGQNKITKIVVVD